MLRKRLLIVGLIFITACFNANEIIFAMNDKPLNFQETLEKMGYKSAEDAVKEFEDHFNQKVNLPQVKPQLPVSLQFGRFYEDKEYDVNDMLEVSYFDEITRGIIYKITVRPQKNKIALKTRPNQKVYTLQTGEQAIYIEDRSFNFLFIDKDKWQYILGINKRVSSTVTPEVLIQIANSIE